MGNIMDKVSGWKTYITLGVGVLIAVVGHFFGPVHAGPVDIPLVETGEMWGIIWAALSATFMRNGVQKAENAAK